MYRSLNPAKILETAEDLRRRIEERFPGSGLGRVAAEVQLVAERSAALADWLARPHRPIRVAVGACIAVLLFVIWAAIASLELRVAVPGLAELAQVVESLVNDIVFVALAIFFLLGWETRIKRGRALKAIHELRSLAHIVDMHQLPKDPEKYFSPLADQPARPRRPMSLFELTRYLDYCSELLSIISKLAALCVQRFNDSVTLASVNEVENLTSGLARKIWQKIMILDRISSAGTTEPSEKTESTPPTRQAAP
jgi:hypothetical protein